MRTKNVYFIFPKNNGQISGVNEAVNVNDQKEEIPSSAKLAVVVFHSSSVDYHDLGKN